MIHALKQIIFKPAGFERGEAATPARLTLVIARTLLGLIFVMTGVGKLFQWDATLGYMAAHGLTGGTQSLLAVAVFAEIVGGLSIITGTFARLGAVGLALYLIPTTFIFHDFWALSGMERQMQMANFLKNLSIIGGLLLLALHGAGPVSVDRRIGGDTNIERRGH